MEYIVEYVELCGVAESLSEAGTYNLNRLDAATGILI